ncbi:MAG TPA: efflux RND transporter periplasmic adaptor subunit [Rickettsia endosymbiont of Sericostoma sp.]|nr:efflux RND transporter periplasmic adaptor subunit [Rickettsia endosymbiont of Sericostoma sp.]
MALMSRRKVIYGILFVITAIVVVIVFIKKANDKQIPAQQVDNQATMVPVEVVKAQYSEETNDILVTTGKTLPYETHAVKVNVTGRIKELDLPIGSYVNKGDILAVLDTTQIDYLIALANEEYRLKEKKANAMKQLSDKNLISYTEYVNHRIEYLDAKHKYYTLLDDKTNHYIVAPLSGVVERKLVADGELVTQKDKIAVLYDIHIIKVAFELDESDYQKFKSSPDSYVNIYIPALDLALKLSDFKTSEIAQEKNHSVYIEAFIPNDDNSITPGLFVNVNVVFNSNKQRIKLPNSAIFFESYYFVYVIENNIAKKVKVEIGDSDSQSVEVVSGIKPNDQVVISGKKGLGDGAKVLIEDETTRSEL